MGYLDWPGFAQACRIERVIRCGDRTTTEIVYAITSVPRSQANAGQLLNWSRGHWGIESLHWIRDVVWGEDHCRVKSGNAPQVLASLRNAAINFLRMSGFTEVAKTLRQHAFQVEVLLALIQA